MRVFTYCLSMCFLWLPAAFPLPAAAARSYDNCTGFVDSLPAVISTQGTWCLRQDVSMSLSAGTAIEIDANNVTLDCNDFKLGGLAGGPATVTTGVRVDGRLNFTMRHCTLRGFYIGLDILGYASGHLVESNLLEGITGIGMEVLADATVVRDNRIVDTGGSTNVNFAAGIFAVGSGVDLLDNSISGVATLESNSSTDIHGIYLSTNDAGAIGRNRIRGVFNGGSGEARAITTAGPGNPMVFDNVLHGTGAQLETLGIFCQSAKGSARGNLLAGFATAYANCTISDNLFNAN